MRNPDYILYLNQQLKKPFVFIELTSKCNFKCYYCNSNISIRPKGFMDQRLFYHIVDQLESISAYRVALHVDGEPTLHPKFEKFISYLNLKKIPISLATNGSLLKESYLKLEYDLLTYLSASAEDFNKRSSMNFDEYNEKLSAYLRKWKELPAKQNIALQVYLDACDSLGGDEVKQKLEFVHCLLSQAGFSEVEFREDMNCFFTFRKSSGYRFTISFISIVSGGLFPVGQPLERAELPKVSAEAGFCDSGWFRMTIFWDGSLGLCCHGIQGETVYTRPEEIWEKSLAWLWLEHPNANLFRKAMSNGRLVLKGCKKCLSRYPNREFYVQRTTFIPKSQVNLGEYHKIDPTYKDNTYAIFGFVPDVANNIVWSVGRRSQFGFRIDSLSEAAYTLEIEGIGFAPEE
ncbi:MAG: radical SAM protein, partial [Desulfobacterales bacterium]